MFKIFLKYASEENHYFAIGQILMKWKITYLTFILDDYGKNHNETKLLNQIIKNLHLPLREQAEKLKELFDEEYQRASA